MLCVSENCARQSAAHLGRVAQVRVLLAGAMPTTHLMMRIAATAPKTDTTMMMTWYEFSTSAEPSRVKLHVISQHRAPQRLSVLHKFCPRHHQPPTTYHPSLPKKLPSRSSSLPHTLSRGRRRDTWRGGGGRRRGSRRSWCNGSPSYLDCYVGREVARLGCGDASVVNRPAVTRQSARAQFLQSSHEIRLEIDRLELRWELVKWRVKGSGWQSAGEEVTGVQSRHALVC